MRSIPRRLQIGTRLRRSPSACSEIFFKKNRPVDGVRAKAAAKKEVTAAAEEARAAPCVDGHDRTMAMPFLRARPAFPAAALLQPTAALLRRTAALL